MKNSAHTSVDIGSSLSFDGHRLPVVLQTENTECGLACLAMIAGYYHFDTDLVSLRHRFSLSSRGTTLQQLMNMAASMNLAPRALRAEPEALDQLQLPCILHWDMSHFVVLKSVSSKKIVIHDPARGLHSLSKTEFEKHFTGVVLELTPTENFEQRQEKKRLSIRQLWSRAIGLKRSIAQILALSFMLQIFSLIAPLYLQIVVDDVLIRNDANLLVVLAIGFSLLMLIQVGTDTLRGIVTLNIATRLGLQMSVNLFRHLIRLPLDYFNRRHMGDIVSRFSSLDTLRQLLTTSLVSAIVDGAMALITLAMMLFYDKGLTLVVIIAVFCYAIIRWAFFGPFRTATENSIVAAAKENSHFMETARAMQTIKVFQKENSRQAEWQNRLIDVVNKNIRIAQWNIGFGATNGFLFGLESILVIYLGALAVMGNSLSIGMLFAFLAFRGHFIGAIDRLITEWINFKMLGLHLNRLADITCTEAEDIDRHMLGVHDPKDHTLNNSSIFYGSQRLRGEIVVQDLAFSYSESEKEVFLGLNFEIRAGETVAITGPSGCGKTTLLKCLMGLMQPTQGKILVDGRSLRDLPYYRAQIAGVMQDDQLIGGSIASNIACFESEIDMEKVYQCAHMAGVHEEIMAMPMQYHTLVGDMGSSLSGGQKQRVILARAFYREPRILFLDEATSHLDITNEKLVNEHIKQLAITRIIVAHRPETIKSSDREINLANILGKS